MIFCLDLISLSFRQGIFFILPCVDNYIKVDLRTVSFDVPPQEVSILLFERPYPLHRSTMPSHQLEKSEIFSSQQANGIYCCGFRL